MSFASNVIFVRNVETIVRLSGQTFIKRSSLSLFFVLSLSLSYHCLCIFPFIVFVFVFVFFFVFEKETGTDLEAIVRIAGESLPLHAFIKFSTGRQFVNGAAGQKEPFPEPVIKWRFITHIGCNLTVRKRVHTIHQTFPTRMNCKICQSRAIIREIG